MRGEVALWHAEKLEVKERHKDNQAFFKMVRWRGRKSEAGILDRDIEEKNWVDVVRTSAVSLPDVPTWPVER